MTKFEAIYKTHPNIVSIIGNDAYDEKGNKVEYDLTLVNAYIASNSYIEKRIKEYPPITDYIDGVVKGDQAQIDTYIKKCLAVKQKYPK